LRNSTEPPGVRRILGIELNRWGPTTFTKERFRFADDGSMIKLGWNTKRLRRRRGWLETSDWLRGLGNADADKCHPEASETSAPDYPAAAARGADSIDCSYQMMSAEIIRWSAEGWIARAFARLAEL
jgi:hypothetical protein